MNHNLNRIKQLIKVIRQGIFNHTLEKEDIREIINKIRHHCDMMENTIDG